MILIRRYILLASFCLLSLGVLFAGSVAWLNVRGESSIETTGDTEAPTADVIERGAYLARAGNCMGCHTVVGGAPFAGGRGVTTPFGEVMTSNITPDSKTGIGSWTSADFWRAMHHGRSKDGRLLYPAFPYPSFTYVTRDDSDALFAYLRSQPPVDRANPPHALRFPYNLQPALAVWRALYFRPADFRTEDRQSVDWNRGKYLVQGLGHCAACHSERNFLGGTGRINQFSGGLMPDGGWYAPSLASLIEAGVQHWAGNEVVKLLKSGITDGAAVSGPMAEVVFSSTQYMTEGDLASMSQYLASIPVHSTDTPKYRRANEAVLNRGSKVYSQNCVACHGEDGKGVAGIYPALAGNRTVTMTVPNNIVQIIRNGGFAPATAGNPRPFGMPPFGQVLNDQDIAAVATFVRQSWGNSANEITSLDVLRVK